MRACRYYGIEDIRIEEIERIEDAVMREHHVKIKPAFVPYLVCGTREDFLALDLPEHPTLPAPRLLTQPTSETSRKEQWLNIRTKNSTTG